MFELISGWFEDPINFGKFGLKKGTGVDPPPPRVDNVPFFYRFFFLEGFPKSVSPGQDSMKQAFLWSTVVCTWHGLPSCVLTHLRVLVFKPFPQLWLHSPQGLQLDQEPSTLNQVLEDELFTFHLKIFILRSYILYVDCLVTVVSEM